MKSKNTLVLLFFWSIVTFSQGNYLGIAPSKDIVIEGKNYATLKGNIEVPEDYKSPNSRKIQLPIFIIKSSSNNPKEPIFWFNGGPGSTNIRPKSRFESNTPPNILDSHDFVCIGYRGIDVSTVLKSKKINKAIKGLNHKLLSEESLNNIETKIKEYQIELQQEGINIDNYSMLDVIKDFESARKILGYKNINTLSVNYGTRLALLYSYKYPEVIKRNVMIGANPHGHFVWFPKKTEQILDIYDSIYKSQNNDADNISIKEIMKTAFDKMPKRWSIFKLDADNIKAGTFSSLYSKTW